MKSYLSEVGTSAPNERHRVHESAKRLGHFHDVNRFERFERLHERLQVHRDLLGLGEGGDHAPQEHLERGRLGAADLLESGRHLAHHALF